MNVQKNTIYIWQTKYFQTQLQGIFNHLLTTKINLNRNVSQLYESNVRDYNAAYFSDMAINVNFPLHTNSQQL